MIVIAVIGVVLVGALMVFAKYRTQRVTPTASNTPATTTTDAPAETAPKKAQPPAKKALTVAELDRVTDLAVARAVTSPSTEPDPESAPTAAPAPPEAAGPDGLPELSTDVAIKLSTGPAPPIPAEGGAAVAEGAEAAEGEPADGEENPDDEEKPEAEEEKPEAKPVKPLGVVKSGTKEELVLLLKAERTLKRLHALRLRTDIAPEVRLAEGRRLSAILRQLPEGTRREMEAYIDAGFDKLAEERGRAPVAGENGAKAVGGDEREAGKFDGRPDDLKQVNERIGKLSQRLGVQAPAPSPPGAGGINPSSLPAARTVNPTTQGGGLPSVQSQGLD